MYSSLVSFSSLRFHDLSVCLPMQVWLFKYHVFIKYVSLIELLCIFNTHPCSPTFFYIFFSLAAYFPILSLYISLFFLTAHFPSLSLYISLFSYSYSYSLPSFFFLFFKPLQNTLNNFTPTYDEFQ